ncbi:hypothetical protein A9Q84_17870 [Halobacteriovorax marinus]|uniref:Lipoprotein n=1 Tax=Halobacteriovorax marinus TaxID=97084 RepID=A0A1Y5F9S1_9BACT|nr:hypothetical protein A9Q84_17870 [Halobacteriovorax marinus]
MKSTMIFGLMVLCGSIFAAEVDTFTARFEYFEDISSVVNRKANESIKAAVAKTQSLSECTSEKSEKVLYKELRKFFANHTKGKFLIDLLHSDEVFKRITPSLDSIYSEWEPLDGQSLGGIFGFRRKLPLSPLVKFFDRFIGIDKFEHMFGMGRRYFLNYYFKGHSLEKVLKRGIFGEKFILGGSMMGTGVFSFGDLSANFNGMRFWNHMLQRRDDVLGSEYNVGPYILCENNKFVVNTINPVDFNNYVDPSMDESINCPKFATKRAVRKYKRALKELGVTCPMSKADLEIAVKKYSVKTSSDEKSKSISHWILNTGIVEDVSYFNEF